MDFSSIDFRLHAVQRMYERGITTVDVKEVMKNGKIIEQYLDDKPFPSYLISGFINEKSLHIVVAIDNKTKKAIIITVYEPDPKLWQAGFEKRR
ncbi:MAG: DUF4258 domain-containing protein [Candidatus Melainabacteria bacterium]|nr:DUF4258 domain-containing protein [Candidatus Melainabacteria bacterium]